MIKRLIFGLAGSDGRTRLRIGHFVVAGVLACSAVPQKADAALPVIDASSIASLAVQINNQVEQLRAMMQQISQLGMMVNLETVAGTTLGESIGPEAGGLFDNLQGAYSDATRAYGSIMRIPAQIEGELALFEGIDELSFPQLVARANRLKRLTAGTSAASIANSAEIVELRAQIAAEAARANGMADRSISALSASQAVAQQMRVVGQQLDLIERNSSSIDENIALRQAEEAAQRDAIQVIAERDQAGLEALIGGEPGRPTSNPVTWGR